MLGFTIVRSIIMFTIGIEMILGHNFSKHEPEVETSSSIIPISFLLIVIARTGILTTVISLKAEYEQWNITYRYYY